MKSKEHLFLIISKDYYPLKGEIVLISVPSIVSIFPDNFLIMSIELGCFY